MEYALGIVGTMQLFVIGWIVAHSSQCARFHERLARLEEKIKMRLSQEEQR
jgi:hypothetical protein